MTESGEENGVKLECGPNNQNNNGVLRLIDSQSFIRCYLPADVNRYTRDKKNYITPLTVRVSYTYVLIEEEKIEIKRNELNAAEPIQGMCGDYEQEVDGKCISKCEYCRDNPVATECRSNRPTTDFAFMENFSCTCSLWQCNTKLNMSSCIKGYCPGDRYCCTSAQCDAYQVEYGGKCIDKCAYCASHPTDSILCPMDPNIDMRNFRCMSMNYSTCAEYSQYQYGACIIGYCGGENMDTRYCANPTAINQAISQMQAQQQAAQIIN
jgi:hypothetical protein